MTESETHPGARVATRRMVVKGVAATAIAVLFPTRGFAAVAARPAPLLKFLDATAKLTGIALNRSYLQMADALWSLLALDVGEGRLRRMVMVVNATREDRLRVTLRRLGLLKAAETVMTAWYTGNVEVSRAHLSAAPVRRLTRGATPPPGSGKTVTLVFNYDEALVWQACSYTKASATCGGPFGYWHDAPAS